MKLLSDSQKDTLTAMYNSILNHLVKKMTVFKDPGLRWQRRGYTFLKLLIIRVEMYNQVSVL